MFATTWNSYWPGARLPDAGRGPWSLSKTGVVEPSALSRRSRTLKVPPPEPPPFAVAVKPTEPPATSNVTVILLFPVAVARAEEKPCGFTVAFAFTAPPKSTDRSAGPGGLASTVEDCTASPAAFRVPRKSVTAKGAEAVLFHGPSAVVTSSSDIPAPPVSKSAGLTDAFALRLDTRVSTRTVASGAVVVWVVMTTASPLVRPSDVVALAERLGVERAAQVLLELDAYYEDQVGAGGRRVATQLARQLAEPAPYDLSAVDLRSYRRLEPRWQEWDAVVGACGALASAMLTSLSEEGT